MVLNYSHNNITNAHKTIDCIVFILIIIIIIVLGGNLQSRCILIEDISSLLLGPQFNVANGGIEQLLVICHDTILYMN